MFAGFFPVHPVVPARFLVRPEFEGVERINIHTVIFKFLFTYKSSSAGNINRRSIAGIARSAPHAVPDSQSCSLVASLAELAAMHEKKDSRV